jgi:osmotically-inducible protein OsmY
MASVDEEVIRRVQAALEVERSVNQHKHPVRASFAGGILTLEGTVEHIAAKRRAVQLARTVSDVIVVRDLLRVRPSEDSADAAARDRLCSALMQEPAFTYCGVNAWVKDSREVLRQAVDERGCYFEVRVQDGVVTLQGLAGSLSHRRLAGVLAWWVSGTQEVINQMVVDPPEEDNDDELSDVVGLVLEKDPFLKGADIGVRTRSRVVTLYGNVHGARDRDLAEYDAWYVDGVEGVDNQLLVSPG